MRDHAMKIMLVPFQLAFAVLSVWLVDIWWHQKLAYYEYGLMGCVWLALCIFLGFLTLIAYDERA